MRKRITFLMPAVQLMPSGGYKIVYEYANRFASDGCTVNILHPAAISFRNSSLKGKLKYLYYNMRFNLWKKFSIQWFKFNPNVNNIFVPNLSEKNIPESDVIIGTGSQTAIPLYNVKKISNEKKYYFIQGYESWAIGLEQLNQTYRLPINKIVIADYLLEKLHEIGVDGHLVYNGLDFEFFKRYNPIEKRDKYTIVMPYNKVKLKGCDVGFEALKIVHNKYPQLKVQLYGVHIPRKLPDYCTFYLKPDKNLFNKILNTSSIFLGPSFSEGFCLTVAEAMQCGCTAVCTNIGGYGVTCIDNETALLGEVGNPQSLAINIIKLIENDDLRYKLANNAYNHIQKFTWERAYTLFRDIINR